MLDDRFEVLEKIDFKDNSGVICEGEGDKVLFTLDLSVGAIEDAQKNGCSLIVTHHPVIFNPIYCVKGVLSEAIKKGVGVVSVHLPADYAPKGVDYYLADSLGAKNPEILESLGGNLGYGRLFEVNLTLSELKEKIRTNLKSVNLSCFGQDRLIKKVATFCGAGLDENALSLAERADAFISSDVKHHVIVKALQMGKNVIMPTHYATENYGFKLIASDFENRYGVKTFYHEDNTLL